MLKGLTELGNLVLNNFESSLSSWRSTPLTLSGSWQAVGSILTLGVAQRLGVYLSWTQNNSLDMRFRVMACSTVTGTVKYPIDAEHFVVTHGAQWNKQAGYIESTTDATGTAYLQLHELNGIAFLEMQVQVGTVGVTPATLDTAKYRITW